MANVGPWEVILLLLFGLLLFGPKRVPEIGRSLGRGFREFKDSVTGKEADDDRAELPALTHEDPADSAPTREREPIS